MNRSRHLKQYTEGAAAEIIRSYLIDRARARGLDVCLDAEDCRAVLEELAQVKRSLEVVRRRGGVVVVAEGGELITAYRCDSLNYGYQDPARHVVRLASAEKHFLTERGVQWL